MAFLLRWWQSFLHVLSVGGGHRDDGWVEPGNQITRAILSGAIGNLPMLVMETTELPAVGVSEDPRPVEMDETLVAETPDERVETPAATEQQRGTPATRTRKRRGRRAA